MAFNSSNKQIDQGKYREILFAFYITIQKLDPNLFSHDISFACVLKYNKSIISISSLYFPHLAQKLQVQPTPVIVLFLPTHLKIRRKKNIKVFMDSQTLSLNLR